MATPKHQPGKDPGKDEAKRKPGRPAERVSLKPLEFEEALADLLTTDPAEKMPSDQGKRGREVDGKRPRR